MTLIGMGLGTPVTMTAEGSAALRSADLLLGAPRLLRQVPPEDPRPRVEAVKPREILEAALQSGAARPCVLYSGDTGFYSGARGLLPLLEARGIPFRVLPGISSVQVLAARLGQPWQDWALQSAHGTACDAVAAVCQGRPAFFLTGGEQDPASLCRQLAQAGLGGLSVTVGENLSLESERIRKGSAGELAGQTFAPLSVMLAQPAPRPAPRTPGIPDGEFLRGEVPMTKQEVRAVLLSKLAVGPGDVCWDIGAGTGSVSVELALCARSVWAVEYRPEALALIERNRVRFGAWNLHPVRGRAAGVLQELPRPDAVFVGGSEGELPALLRSAFGANPSCRVCVAAVTLETLHTAVETLASLGKRAEVVQIGVARARAVGERHLMTAQNPVYLILGS